MAARTAAGAVALIVVAGAEMAVPGPGVGQEGVGNDELAGWAFQWLSQLSFSPGSQPAPQDQVRTGTGDDAGRAAARQRSANQLIPGCRAGTAAT